MLYIYRCLYLQIYVNFDWTGLRLVFNVIIFISASRRLLEFRGYRGRRYPGQLPPPPPTILPRRLVCSQAVDEWKKIGSRRKEFLDLGLPVPRKQAIKTIKTIFVAPITDETEHVLKDL